MSDRNELRDAYDVWHQDLDVNAQPDEPWYQLVRAHLDPTLDVSGKRILEIGCGRGGFVCWLARQAVKAREIVAVDLSAVAIGRGQELAERGGIRGITWSTGDIQELAYPDASFDTVVSCETVEHVPDPRRAIRSLARVLRPSGRLFLSTPNYLSTYGLYRAYLRVRGRRFTEVGQPINNFTTLPGNLGLVRDAGLSIEVVDAVGHYMFWPGHSPRRIWGLDLQWRALLRWFALHSLIVARRRP